MPSWTNSGSRKKYLKSIHFVVQILGLLLLLAIAGIICNLLGLI